MIALFSLVLTTTLSTSTPDAPASSGSASSAPSSSAPASSAPASSAPASTTPASTTPASSAPSASASSSSAPAVHVSAAAQALIDDGEAAYKAGHYDDALAALMAAYDTSKMPRLLFEIGECQRQLKHHERAVDFYQRYLAAMPDAANKADVEALIASEKKLAPQGLFTSGGSFGSGAASSSSTIGQAPAMGNPFAKTVSKDAHPDAPSLWQEPAFWGVAGGATAAVLVGATVAVIVATQPAPAKPTGSLGTFDLRPK